MYTVQADVPYMPFHTIRWKAERFLEQFQPDALCRPEPLDVIGLVEMWLPLLGVQVRTGGIDEMGEIEACTVFTLDDVEIVVREDQMTDLYANVPRPKSSVSHEVGHVVLHRPHVLGRCGRSADDGTDRPGCAEWQAWAFAGALLMPVPVIQELTVLDEVSVSRVFDVSPEIAFQHLRRLQRNHLI